MITDAIILAAGKGTRLPSPKPKPLQVILGDSMLSLVCSALHGTGVIRSVHAVIGHGADAVRAMLEKDFPGTRCVLQTEQKGTGHAVALAAQSMRDPLPDAVLVINADMPLLTSDILAGFLERAAERDMAFMSLTLEDPAAYGRVIRDSAGKVAAIVEYKDFRQLFPNRECREINAGVYFFRFDLLLGLLPLLSDQNAAGEYYITDLVKMAIDAGKNVEAISAGSDVSLLGVNTPSELADAEEILRSRRVQYLLAHGVVLHAPESVRIGKDAVVEPGCEIYGPCELYGRTTVRKGAVIESHCVLIDTAVGENTIVRPFCHFEGASAAANCKLGPFARLRPGAVLEDDVHIGDFVEIKKSRLAKGSKANHLSYLGDAEIGEGVNVGAGCITCNYDGKNKFRTTIEDGAFLGSNCAFVAPVTIGAGALVAAGSVITKNVPQGALAFGRSRQINKEKK